jgi:molybdopterin synthase catalytic subunit
VVRLQSDEIRLAEVLEAVGSDRDGAVALFLGTVRDHNRGRRVLYLEYEAYAGMAESEMTKLAREAERRFEVSAVALVHRTGRLEIGEVSVAAAVAAPHRAAAFEACRFVIDELKRTVPIWKKEAFAGGEVWIEGTGETRIAPAHGEDPHQA